MLTLSTAFPGGSAADLRQENGQVRFSARKGGGPVSMWWHFGVTGETPRVVDFIWEKTGEVLGSGGLGAAVPVFNDGTGWRRVSARHCLYLPDRREFHFRVPCRVGLTQVAYCFPYGWERIEEFGREMAATGLATLRQISSSAEGRPFELLEFGSGPVQVWVTARHHSGETPGAYVLEGMVREALRLPRLLRAASFHVAAAMDVDGVAEGLYGKDRGPRDFNRDYVSQPCRPEVAALRQAAEALGRVDLFLDLHAPAPGDC
ncbi:MAG: M14 family zinc carboxypeptidase, partial [Armatimonadota bacterium]